MSRKFKDKALYLLIIGSMVLTIVALCYLYFFKVLEVDLSKNMQISYTGESGYASVEIKSNPFTYDQRYHSFLENITYEVYPNEGLSNGDTVQVKAKYDKGQADEYNYHVINDQQTVLIEGLATRYIAVEEIPKELRSNLNEISFNYITTNEKEIINYLLEDTKLSKPELTKKEIAYQVFMKSNTRARGDSIFQLYKVEIEGLDEDNKKQTKEFYYGLEFEGINSATTKDNNKLIVEKVYQDQLKDLKSVDEFMRYVESKFSLEFNEFYIIPNETAKP